jgi:ABC-2 type transport system permease protein
MTRALGKRDLRRYLSNPTGYVFITLFILLSAAAAFWRPQFFQNNLANLDQINEVFPYLLLYFIPALSMGLWSDERRQGTDELLLTLPVSSESIVFGKYAAALGIYSISLAASLSHAIVLAWLGHPDIGLLGANYLGFWILGAALIPVAMLASMLAANATIAFVFAVLLCAVPIGVSQAAVTISDKVGRMLVPYSVLPHFSDFARGIVPLDGCLYFVSLATLFLYLNVLVLERRNWRSQPGAWPPSTHAAIRAAALLLITGVLVTLAARTHIRLDLTSERLSSLGSQSKTILSAIPTDHPVLIQAFVSPEVPETLVQARENLLGILREIEARSGARVTVSIEETQPFSELARLARERYGILPRAVSDPSRGETFPNVFLGVAVTSGAEEQVIPFIDAGLSPEYELARAIRVVTGATRKRIGVLDTDVKILGGVDYRGNQPHAAWALVDELRKQYDVVEVTPASAPDAQIDALLMVMPSRMTQTELDLTMQPVLRGVPTLMLVDPLPMFNVQLAPAADLAQQVNPYAPSAATHIVYGSIRPALENLGVNWVPAMVVWDAFNPHPDLKDLPAETVFVGPGNGNPDALNRRNPATARLQEVLMLYPGYLEPSGHPQFTFEPLLQTGRVSGVSSFFDLVAPTRQGMVVNPHPAREASQRTYVMAGRTRSKAPVVSTPGARPVDLITVADLDFISDEFFEIRAADPNATFDNVVFFLNALDLLAGDESFIALRSRRGRYRTLERVEAQTRGFMERRASEDQEAEKEARTAIEDARNRLKKRIADVEARNDLDAQAKQMMLRNLQETENRQLNVLRTNIEDAKNAKIRTSREAMEIRVGRIRTRIRASAVLLPPLPVFIAGVAVYLRRLRREHASARLMGRLREAA